MCKTISADTELSNVASCGLLAILEEKLDRFEVPKKTRKCGETNAMRKNRHQKPGFRVFSETSNVSSFSSRIAKRPHEATLESSVSALQDMHIAIS